MMQQAENTTCVSLDVKVAIPAQMQVKILSRYHGAGFMMIETLCNIIECQCSMTASDLKEILLGEPAYVYTANTMTMSVSVTKFMIVASASDASTCIVHTHDDDP